MNDKKNVKYVPSWTRKSPCVPTKRSKLTVCGKGTDDTLKDDSSIEGVRKSESGIKVEDLKNPIDLRETPIYSWDDMALRMVAPLPSEFVSKKKTSNEVPFHIPHKRILFTLNINIPELEPLPGYLDSQNRRRRPRTPTPEKVESEKSLEVKIEESEGEKKKKPPPDLINVKALINNMRSQPSFTFVYLVHGVHRTSEFYTPFAFRIVPFEDIIGKNFCTVSTVGVMFHSPGETTFTPLDEWEKEYDFFCRLTEIRLFKLFRIWKTFYVWKKTVSWKKYTDARIKLALNLFILNPVLKDALLEVKNMCVKLEKISFPDLTRTENFRLFEFVEVQMGKVEEVSETLSEFREIVKNLINTACHGALMVEGFTTDDSNVRPSQCGLNQKKNKDGVLKMSYTEQANKRRVCERLASFINLVDYILMNLYQGCILNSLKALDQELQKHLKFMPTSESLLGDDQSVKMSIPRPETYPQQSFFMIDVYAEIDKLITDPNEQTFLEVIQELLNWYDQKVTELTPLVQDPFFLPFIEPVINDKHMERVVGEGPSIVMTMQIDPVIQELRYNIIEYLRLNFAHVEYYLRRLDYIHEFYRENCLMDHELILKEKSPTVMRAYLQKYHDQIEMLENVGSKQALGIITLLLEDFKAEIMPSPLELLSLTEKVVPKLGSARVETLTKECSYAIDFLELYPSTTKEFVRHLEFIEEITARLDIIEAEIDYAKEIYDLIEEFEVPVPVEEVEAYYNFSSVLTSLRNFCDKKNIDKQNLIDTFNKQLSKDISELIKEVGVIQDELIQDWLIQKKSNPTDCKFTLNVIYDQLLDCQRRALEIKGYQKQFRLEITKFEMLDEVINDVRLRQLLWDSLDNWKKTYDEYMFGDFSLLNPEDVNIYVTKIQKSIGQLEKGLPKNDIIPAFKDEVDLFREKIPVITHLRNPYLKHRHWIKIETALNYKIVPGEKLTLKKFEELGALQNLNELKDISAQASSEASLELLLKRVEDSWKELEFIVMPYRDYRDVFILGPVEEVQQTLDDSFINVNTILTSRHVGPIKGRVDEWYRTLELFTKTMDEWIICQTNWLYLESIFSAPDIQRQLPNEAKMFVTVDKTWKDIMRRTNKNPLALQAATFPGTLDALVNNNKLLDQILKCLEAYLETKRVIFPRFYFLSNEELLEILAQTRNPHAVQPHLRKCFDAISKLEFGISTGKGEQQLTSDIIAMISPEGEKVPLGKGLKARGNVEDWLGKVEESMLVCLRRGMRFALMDYQAKERTVWVLNHPSQITLTVSQIMWCKNIHQILDGTGKKVSKLAEFEEKNYSELNRLAAMVRGNLTKLGRLVLCSLITIDVHARDIVTGLVKEKVDNSNSFEWLKCLRYYWDEEIDNCVARMSNAYYIYGYEYLGASPRLVITPLTDKCYLCLMGALQLDLGGAPAGPAGTGKTETTKDLAKSLAIQCVVFNCSEGLDYKMMGRFFSGLAQSGAWCCFDEFNRIDIEVLSVIAQQLITIRNAKAAKLTRFMFEGREIKLVRQCAAFITMNPGYAGRTELPDNLKALFRPMAMMVPDYALIAEVILYSEGFESSKILAHKMTQMYKLCSEQLSLQDHYDFGMRAVKSVLVMAGTLKRENPDKSEDVVLIRALRDSNLPKFLSNDALLFQGILSDLFPGVVLPEQDYGEMETAIIAVTEEAGLQPERCMIRKVIMLYETMLVRHGVMLVGPTGGGKTTVLNTLKNTLDRLHEMGVENPQYRPVQTYIMNPKSITIGELYGEFNLMTMEWRDGVLGMAVRTAVQCPRDDHQWVICDGPVDAVWIENMNTVLDDNKMLCLANSERIKYTPYVHMLFEVMDLAQASPATVSRCGMVYVDPEELKWVPYVKTWLSRLPESINLTDDFKKYLLNLFETHIDDCLYYLKKNCTFGIPQVDISKITCMCKLLEAIFSEPNAFEKNMDKSKTRTFISQSFAFSMVWALGGNINEQHRDLFEVFLRAIFDEHEDARLATTPDLWGMYIDVQSKKVSQWTKIIPSFTYKPNTPYFEILVPTQDTVRFGYLMEKLLSVNQAVMFTGNTGVGKSVIAKAVLKEMATNDAWVPIFLNFSAQTSSVRTQEMIEAKLEKKKKTVLGAPSGKRVVVFVDDVNMPKLDTYGSQPPIELLRQYLDYGGLYDREKLFWKEIHDVLLSTACAPPGGGRNPLTPRFVRHFSMFLIPFPAESALKMIFRAILQGFFLSFVPSVRDLAFPIVNAALEIYERISVDLLPTPAKSHYVFNLRDLSKCIQGTLQADPSVFRENIHILRLFYHECLRVFHDRLVNKEDKSYFYFLLKEVCSKVFGTPVLFFDDEPVLQNPPILIFGDFMNQSVAKQDRYYEEIKNLTKLRTVLKDILDDYNLMTSKDMKIIFFMDAVEHTARLARILRAERGNGLLVGVSGMGKQSLTKLSSHANGYKCYQIQLTRSYDHGYFQDDLRKLYFNAGAKGEETAFLFTDSQIVQEEFLEDINNILNSGEVPNLFEGEEYEKVINACRPTAREYGIMESNRDQIFNFFVSRVREKLHVVLCMSPIGDAFRRRCRMFPSIVNCCTIDWFMPWPTEALVSVAKESFINVSNEETVENLAMICVTMHESVEEMTHRLLVEKRRYYYTTPSSYLELLKNFKYMLNKKTTEIAKSKERIVTGLDKLYETNKLVDQMKIELTAFAPKLKAKSDAANALMVNLSKEQAAADKVRLIVLSDEAKAKRKAVETRELADDAQKDLAEAMPAMEQAMKALEALNKNDINELKVFNKPPEMVKVVMEAVCLLLGVKQDWASAKLTLGDVNFLRKLQEYDRDHMPESLLRTLRTKYLSNPDFVPEKIALISKVAKSLCLWVRAIDVYAKVYKYVEPKRKAFEAAETELNVIMSVLKEKQKKLAEVEEQIANLEAKFEASMEEKRALEDTMAVTMARLGRSGRLTSALADEQIQWEEQIRSFSDQLENILGDVLIAAACMSYQGAFPADFREILTDIWLDRCFELELPTSEDFSLIRVLGDPYEIRLWNTYDLPRDQFSIENGVLVTKTQRWPLMIDPQEQANRWIRNMEGENGLKICRLTDSQYMLHLESCIRVGVPALLEGVGETLDPTLNPILQKQIFVQGGRTLIHLGDSDVDYDMNFRFYITTKLANPHYLPEVCILLTLVNFTVTPSGLEDQLLADVVRLERPDLEKTRTELITRINNDKCQLNNIEEKILKMLFSSTGNILDDEELIEALNESKETTEVIATRLIESEATEEKITVAREKYRIVAVRGSILYFVVAQLAEIDPMYQFSLKYFNHLFNNVIETTEKVKELEGRLQLLVEEITLAIYSNVSRGLFEKHKLIYSFMMCINILAHDGAIPEVYWNFLLRGVPPGAKIQPTRKKPEYPALTEAIWNAANYLASTFPTFKGLDGDIMTKIKIRLGNYEYVISINVSTKDVCKTNWNDRLNDLEKLVLLKALCEEKLVFAITEFVKKNLGKSFVESPPVDLHRLFQDTSCTTPLIFILSTGSDPMGSFQRFAIDKNYQNRIQAISLGQGQGPVAEKMLKSAGTTGDWVFLQNCHLATSWMIPMERKIMAIVEGQEKVHTDFRLFLSSMPTASFPVSVLQDAVKVTNEPPKGLKSNIKTALFIISRDFFEDHPLQSSWRKMIFGICFFHAIIQERKKFGPLGWNITYEFNDSDRECALLNLQMFCTQTSIPWDALEYTTGEITYGGRVTDSWDQRCLKTILKTYFSPAVLAPGYKYSASGTYYCPESAKIKTLEKYREFIELLPMIEEPEIFGMHENANITFQIKETQAILLTILEIQPREGGGEEGKTKDDTVYGLADSMKKRIMANIDPDKALPALIIRDNKDRLPSLTTVLFQEVDRFNKLLRILHTSLSNLQKAIKGLVVMSEQLEDIYKAFTNYQIPKVWEKSAYPSLKTLASWITDLELRLDFISIWVTTGAPLSYWISGFFFPQGFLTGVLQTYARKHNTPIDQLKFDFIVQSDSVDQKEVYKTHQKNGKDIPGTYGNLNLPKDGVLVHGLFLDAARWDYSTMVLTDPYPGEMNPPLPALLVNPQINKPNPEGRYVCPLYKTSIRAGVLSTTGHSTNFVVPVLLPTDRPQSVWIIQGTALLTQITD